jgi:peptidoglycan/xylan/chitin deacetylase (PgdA/CDA1 family)
LRRHGAPWTEFVTTEFADGVGRLWWVELEEAVRRLDRLTVAGEAGAERHLAAGTAQEKRAAFAEIYRSLRAGPEQDLRAAIATLAREAGLDSDALVRRLCLGWADLAQLAQDGDVTIGAHTLTHPMLAKHDAATARREIVDAKRIIESRLGTEVRHIAYPVGDPSSAGPREFEEARAAGYLTGVTTRPGHLFAGHADHLTALPRVSVNGLYQTEAAMRALLSGAPFLLWNRGRQLNVA